MGSCAARELKGQLSRVTAAAVWGQPAGEHRAAGAGSKWLPEQRQTWARRRKEVSDEHNSSIDTNTVSIANANKGTKTDDSISANTAAATGVRDAQCSDPVPNVCPEDNLGPVQQ